MPYYAIAHAFVNVGKAEEAQSILDECTSNNPSVADTKEFLYCQSLVYESIGRYKDALEAHKMFHKIENDYHKVVVSSNINNIEDRLAASEKQLELSRQRLVLEVIIALALLLLIILSMRYINLNRLYRTASTERDTLSAFMDRYVDANWDVANAIGKRLKILNNILLFRKTGLEKFSLTYNAQIKALVDDNDEFLTSIATSFSCTHPKFVIALQEKGLDFCEIGFCCLFLLDFSGKEIKNQIHLKDIYNCSSAIRHKLGLGSHDSNLGVYLKQLASQ